MELTILNAPGIIKHSQDKRAEGLHLTDIIVRMAKDGRALYWEDYKQLSPADQQYFEESNFKPGFFWEEVLSSVYAEQWATRPEPYEFEGIWVSPDGIFTPEQVWELFKVKVNQNVLSESKWTSKKNDKYPDNPAWINAIIQTKSYCFTLGLNQVIFSIAYSNGDYKRAVLTASNGVEIKCQPHGTDMYFLVEYTQEELIENWNNVTMYRDKIMEERNAVK